MNSTEGIEAIVWDGLSPQERKCFCLMIDSINGHMDCWEQLNREYSHQFIRSVMAKTTELSRIAAPATAS